jgi:8-oxo-dGTP pyrophosphatase MutT (NUDIX family)
MRQVVVGIISRNRNNTKEYLLISSKKDFGKYTGFYYPPGGHLEENEDEKTALIREINEELGIKVNPLNKIAETPGDVKNQITHWWMCDADIVSFHLETKELSGLYWITKGKILNHKKVWPATKSFFNKYIPD